MSAVAWVEVTGNVMGPSTDIKATPRSSWVLCKRHRVESAGVPCMGHEPWSAPSAHVHTMSDIERPAASTVMVVPVTTRTCRDSQVAVNGMSRRLNFATCPSA